MPPWALITPASRGIGLELARRVLRTTTLPVVATARHDLDAVRAAILAPRPLDAYTSPEPKGQRLSAAQARVVAAEADPARLHVLALDVTDEASVAAAAQHCRDTFGAPPAGALRLAVALPGILRPEKSPAQIDAEGALETFRVNALGPLLLMKHFAGFLPRKATPLGGREGGAEEEGAGWLPRDHAVWATLSARVGSISDNSLGGWYSYRASKAAVNQAVRTFDNYLRATSGERAMAVALHPGTVRTGLSEEFWGSVKEEKLFRPEYAAEKLCAVLGSLEVGRGRGRCWDWKGEEVPP